MTQEYTPVAWQDETTSQQGTLINAERLNQMQTAHHFADGLEEVDAVPTADPGVAYHKIVYCTADSTIYRWDGTEWTADIDDDTKRLLEEHEADHDNPHVVTKAQVGLGNADNTADLDKPISTATQTALNAKLDKMTYPIGTPERAYVVFNGQSQRYREIWTTAKENTLIARTVDGRARASFAVDTYTDPTDLVNYEWTSGELADKADKSDTYTKAEIDTAMATKADKATTLAGYGITDAYTKSQVDTYLAAKADQATTYTKSEVNTALALKADKSDTYSKSEVNTALALKADKSDTYSKSEVQTYVSDALDGYLPMVRTTGNQDISGNKTFTSHISAAVMGKTARMYNSNPIKWYELARVPWGNTNRYVININGAVNGSNSICYGKLMILGTATSYGANWIIRKNRDQSGFLTDPSIFAVIANGTHGTGYLSLYAHVGQYVGLDMTLELAKVQSNDISPNNVLLRGEFTATDYDDISTLDPKYPADMI